MNKAQKFVKRSFYENRKNFYLMSHVYAETVNDVCKKFDGKKIPPEYEKALLDIKNNLFEKGFEIHHD